jgi:hypothetical protein
MKKSEILYKEMEAAKAVLIKATQKYREALLEEAKEENPFELSQLIQVEEPPTMIHKGSVEKGFWGGCVVDKYNTLRRIVYQVKADGKESKRGFYVSSKAKITVV